jgi:hypothetical protein
LALRHYPHQPSDHTTTAYKGLDASRPEPGPRTLNPMHTILRNCRHTLRITNTLQRNQYSTLNRPQHRAAKMPLVVPGVTADNMSNDMVNEWMNKLAGKTISEEPSSETVSRLAAKNMCQEPPLTCAHDRPDLLQDRPPPEDARHRARRDGNKGLQPRQAQRLCQGRRDRLACVPGLRLGVTSLGEGGGGASV